MNGDIRDLAAVEDSDSAALDPYPVEPAREPRPRPSADAQWRGLANPTRVRR